MKSESKENKPDYKPMRPEAWKLAIQGLRCDASELAWNLDAASHKIDLRLLSGYNHYDSDSRTLLLSIMARALHIYNTANELYQTKINYEI